MLGILSEYPSTEYVGGCVFYTR